jgi:hypothetical protein
VDRADAIASLVDELAITRLCHLTPVRNLVHLACDDAGLLSLRELAEREGTFNQQDLERLDNHPDHLSCSIEYPNGWYLRQRRRNATPIQRLFPDWVCLAIDRKYLWQPGTRVCIRNAAAAGGTLVEDVSVESLSAMYSSPILGAGGAARKRSETRIRASPTDDQAEVLVRRSIPLQDVLTVIVPSESDAKAIHTALTQIGGKIEDLQWAIAPTLFSTQALSSAISAGAPPTETPWEPA